MYERSYGYKYEEQQGKTTAEIAGLIRRDIKQAIADGLLPGKPVKYSVRTDVFAGGSAIRVSVQDWADAWQDCDGYVPGSEAPVSGHGRDLCRNYFCAARLELLREERPGAETHQVLTPDARAAQMTLERIHQAYNHDGSEAMTDYFDVNYYGSVEFESPSSAAWRAEERAKIAARRAAVDEIATAGEKRRVVVYGSKGKRTYHDAVTVDGRERLVCGATLWRSSVVGDGTGRELTCSRCVKRAAATAQETQSRPMFSYEVGYRIGQWRKSTIRMSLGVDDRRLPATIRAMFPTASHYRLAGSSMFWRPLDEN